MEWIQPPLAPRGRGGGVERLVLRRNPPLSEAAGGGRLGVAW